MEGSNGKIHYSRHQARSKQLEDLQSVRGRITFEATHVNFPPYVTCIWLVVDSFLMIPTTVEFFDSIPHVPWGQRVVLYECQDPFPRISIFKCNLTRPTFVGGRDRFGLELISVICRASHRPYYGDGRRFYARKMPLVKTAVPFFMTTNCQQDRTGEKRVQTAVYGRLPGVTSFFLKYSTKSYLKAKYRDQRGRKGRRGEIGRTKANDDGVRV